MRQDIASCAGLRSLLVVPAAIALALMLVGCDWQATDSQPPQAHATATATATLVGDATSPAVAQATLTSSGAGAPGVPTSGPAITPVTTPAPAEAPATTIYTVQEGDTLGAIALQF